MLPVYSFIMFIMTIIPHFPKFLPTPTQQLKIWEYIGGYIT